MLLLSDDSAESRLSGSETASAPVCAASSLAFSAYVRSVIRTVGAIGCRAPLDERSDFWSGPPAIEAVPLLLFAAAVLGPGTASCLN
jgi:hypothetical protein